MIRQQAVAGLIRYPVKGFSGERLNSVDLVAGENFPCDRLFAIENGPSGFDPDLPKHISKQKFTVLARAAELARLRTRYDDVSGVFYVSVMDETFRFDLSEPSGVTAFEAFLEDRFSEHFPGPLKLIKGPGQHRFTDRADGHVSLLNLASVRAFEDACGDVIDPSRFRMNIEFEADAWAEDGWETGAQLSIGDALLEVIVPTVRCKATHANPYSGEYDFDLVPTLFKCFNRTTMGVYARVIRSGSVGLTDTVECVS